jgi:hypothetical protein
MFSVEVVTCISLMLLSLECVQQGFLELIETFEIFLSVLISNMIGEE